MTPLGLESYALSLLHSSLALQDQVIAGLQHGASIDVVMRDSKVKFLVRDMRLDVLQMKTAVDKWLQEGHGK